LKLYLVVTPDGRQRWHRNRTEADRTIAYLGGELRKLDMNERRTQQTLDFLNEHARWERGCDEQTTDTVRQA